MRGAVKWRDIALALAGVAALIWAAPAPAQPALHEVAKLRQQVSGFAGGQARMDPALVVPRCIDPGFSWARADVVRVDCTEPAWTLYVPIDLPPSVKALRLSPPRPAIRRGDRVMVEAGGAGFAVTLEAEAERDAEGSRVALKTAVGRRLIGRIEEGGRVTFARD